MTTYPLKPYPHFYIRLCLALVATHIILVYGESKTSYQLLVDPAYYQAFPFSFIIALVLIEVVYRLTDFIDQHMKSPYSLKRHAVYQFLLGICCTGLLAFLLAAAQFSIRGVSILETNYLDYDFPFIISKIIILNLLYFLYYYHQRTSGYHQPAQNDLEGIISPQGMVAISTSLHLPADTIRYIHYDGTASVVYTDNGNHVTMQTLNAIHEVLGSEAFYRLKRNMIVGRKAITEIRRQGRDVIVSLEPPFDEELRISKTPKTKFLNWSSKGVSRS